MSARGAAALVGLAGWTMACDPTVAVNVAGDACDPVHPCPSGWRCLPGDGGVCEPADAGVAGGTTGGRSGSGGRSSGAAATSAGSSGGSGASSGTGTAGGGTGSTGSTGSASGGSGGSGAGAGSTGSTTGGVGSSGGSSGGASGGGRCTIQGQTFDAGAVDPQNPCDACNPGASATAWTPVSSGTACDGGLCAAGSCQPGCLIAGELLASGAIDPVDPCRVCAPADSTSAWSAETDGTPCGPGSFCTPAGCEDGCVSDGGTGCGCASGRESCAGADIDTCVDSANCGGCSNACNPGSGCFGGSCTFPAPLPGARYSLSAVLGGDGRVYALGGFDATQSYVPTVTAFDPRTNAWDSSPPPMLNYRAYFPAAVDAAGNLYAFTGRITGDYLIDNSEVWAPGESGWVTVSAVSPYYFADTGAAVGPGGVFYMPGGVYSVQSPASITSTFDPVQQVWGTAPALLVAKAFHGVAAAPDGTIFAMGGTADYATPLEDDAGQGETEALVPGAAAWAPRFGMPTPRCELGAATDRAGLVYAIGGNDCVVGAGSGYRLYGAVEAFDSDGGYWLTGLPQLPTAVDSPGCATGADGRIYVIGGWNGFAAVNDVQVYEPARGDWIP